MSRERELEKFVKGAFFDGFLIGYDTGANDGALDSEEEKKELEKIARYGNASPRHHPRPGHF